MLGVCDHLGEHLVDDWSLHCLCDIIVPQSLAAVVTHQLFVAGEVLDQSLVLLRLQQDNSKWHAAE